MNKKIEVLSRRIQIVNSEVRAIMYEFKEEFNLVPGKKYHIKDGDGETYYGFFRQFYVVRYGYEVSIYVSFWRMKKDGTPSKVDRSTRMDHVESIVEVFD